MYWALKGSGGLFKEQKALGADARFVYNELSIAANPAAGAGDRIRAGILGVFLGLAATPKAIDYFMPRGQGIDYNVNPARPFEWWNAFLNMRFYRMFFYLLSFQIFLGCGTGAGTLGGFEPVTFSRPKEKIRKAIDSLFVVYPEYRIPEKWGYWDNWKERGYGFLQSYIFYFEGRPEEMYYVTILGDGKTQADSAHTEIAIRAINRGKNRWLLHEDLSEGEKDRIMRRFDSEIISKLKFLSKGKSRN
jgi:hypothetical protein